MRLCILMGSANISGGSYVIFQHALHAQSQGHDVTIVTLEPMSLVTVKWHPALEKLKFVTLKEAENALFDLALATWWKTVYELHRINARQYAYFVQSIESWFYPDCEVALRNLAHSTYLLDMPGVTEAKWIQQYLRERFGRQFHLVPNGILKQVYREDGVAIAERPKEKLRVLVEGPLGVDFKNVARTLELVKRSNADEIWLLTISPIDTYPGVDRVFSRIPALECPALYRSCNILVKLSYIEGMFGPPLEMFHCGGTAIVYNVSGHEEYIKDGYNAIVIAKGDEKGVIASINRLKDHSSVLADLVKHAGITASQWPDWDHSSTAFEAALSEIMHAPAVSREKLKLQTEEYFRQYLRTENAALASRKASRRHHAGVATRRLARVVSRNKWVARKLCIAQAYFVESRRQHFFRELI